MASAKKVRPCRLLLGHTRPLRLHSIRQTFCFEGRRMKFAVGKTGMNCRLHPLSAALVLAGLLVTPVTGRANDWVGGTGDWDTGVNWSGGVPTAFDGVLIDGGQANVRAPGSAGYLLGSGGVVNVTS